MLRLDPTRLDSYHSLFRMWAASRHLDKAICAAHVLAFAKALTEAETASFTDARSRAPGPNTEEQAAVAGVLWQLSDRHREVLMLCYWDGLTTAEMAQALGCSTSAAAVRLHRARRAFADAAPAQLMTERKG